MRQLRKSLSWLRVAEVRQGLGQHVVPLGQQLQERLVLVQELVQRGEPLEQLLELEQQSRHRNREQRLQVSKRHHASTGCRRRFSTADCRGQSASYPMRR